VTCNSLAFPFCMTHNQPFKNNHVYILLACLNNSHALTSTLLLREFFFAARLNMACLWWMWHRSFVVVVWQIICFRPYMPLLSIETRCRVILLFLFKWWNAHFFYSRKINQRRIQNQLEVMFHVSLRSVFQTTIHFRSLQWLIKKFATTKSICDLSLMKSMQQ